MTQTLQLWKGAKIWSRTERQCEDSLKMQASSVSLLNIETTHFRRSPLVLRHRDNCETSWLFLTSGYKCVFTCKAFSGAHFLLVLLCCVFNIPTPDRWEGTFFMENTHTFLWNELRTFLQLFRCVDLTRRFVCCSCLLIRQKQEGYWYSSPNP